jgi:hypothetical protein
MPKRIRPYGSAEDAEYAGLARSQTRAGEEGVSELASTMTAQEIAARAAEAVRALTDLTRNGATDLTGPREVREVIAGLGLMGQDMPRLCEQLARVLMAQREDGQIADGAGHEPHFLVIEVVEALAAAGQAADMMTAALDQAVTAAADLRAGLSWLGSS